MKSLKRLFNHVNFCNPTVARGSGGVRFRNLRIAPIFLALTASLVGIASASQTEMIELSLQDLMNLKIEVGTLTGMARNKIPVSLTTISAEDIALTPARSINDLLEIYVPGASWNGHLEMAHPGIRGVMSDRNVKFLLLADGYEMNQLTHAGAVSELENWDLNEIDRIEVIRGPGSVTYGPGAISGVINIVTKSAADWGGLRVGANANATYRSYGGYGSYGKQLGGLQIFTYGSLTRTLGQKDPSIFVAIDSVSGYAGPNWLANAKAHKDSRATNPTSFGGSTYPNMGDYKDWPQGKFGIDARYGELRLLGRFTNSGNNQMLVGAPTTVPDADGGRSAQKQDQIRQCLLALENEHTFSPLWRQVTKVNWNDQDYSRFSVTDTNNFEAPRNYQINLSEQHLAVQSLAQLTLSENYRFALGGSYSRNSVGAPWFQDAGHLRLGDAQNFFGGDSTSLSTDSMANLTRGIWTGKGATPAGSIAKKSVIWVGDGWSTNSYSLLGEANLAFHPLATLLLSGRADKDDNSNWGLSPRVAFISELNDQNVLKLIWQRSVRMNNSEIAYQQKLAGTISDPEVLTGYEAIYNWQLRTDLSFQTSGFYNDYNILGYNNSNQLTQKLGHLQMAGLEIEGKYSTPKLTVGFNHSFDKQLSWELSSDPAVKGGTSYADIRYRFGLPSVSVTTTVLGSDGTTPLKNSKGTDSTKTVKVSDSASIQNTGNDILNWANQSSKLYVNWKVIEPVTLHVDAQAFYGYQGEKDMLTALHNMANSLPVRDSVTARNLKSVIADAESRNAFDPQFRLNASVAWHFKPWATATVYSQNLISLNANRYAYDAVNAGIWPVRANWVEEPRTIGAKLDIKIP